MSASRSTPETVGRAAPLLSGDSSGASTPLAEPEASVAAGDTRSVGPKAWSGFSRYWGSPSRSLVTSS